MIWRAFRFLSLLTTTTWWGGLSVYAWIVVPIATESFGATSQGFVTRQVTLWLNGFAAASLVLTAWETYRRREAWMMSMWVVLLATLLSLQFTHGVLDAMMEPTTEEVADPESFYQWHRVYLWVTTVQWFAGIGFLWPLLTSPASNPVNHPTPGHDRERS